MYVCVHTDTSLSFVYEQEEYLHLLVSQGPAVGLLCINIESQERAEQQILTGSTERRENCPRVPASLSVPCPVHTERQTLTACTLFNRSCHY